jgi:large subunit ribosomal protein L25
VENITLEAAPRQDVGRHVSRLRREGRVPGVIYGHEVQPVAVDVDGRALMRVVAQAGRSTLVSLKVGGGRAHRVLIKDLQIDPRHHRPTHVDFYQVNLREKVTVEVPVNVAGDAPAVQRKEGDLQVIVHALRVTALPDHLPQSVEVDISHLEAVDDAVRLQDLRFAEGVEVHGDPEEILVKIAAHRVAAVEEVEAPTEAAEGEAPAAVAAATTGEGEGG